MSIGYTVDRDAIIFLFHIPITKTCPVDPLRRPCNKGCIFNVFLFLFQGLSVNLVIDIRIDNKL